MRLRQQRTRIDYPEIMRTLGHFIQREHLSEVSIVEFDQGWIISGLTFKSTAQGFIRVPTDFVLSHEDIRTMTEELMGQRRQEAPVKRRWLR